MDLIGVLDHETNRKIKEYNIQKQGAWILTYEKLFKQTEFVKTMRNMLTTLENAYTYPVDMEFTANYISHERLKINLVQCRPLQTKGVVGSVDVPKDIDESRIVLSTKGHFMGGSIDQIINRIFYVDPKGYSSLSTENKYALTKIIGQLNKTILDKEEMNVMLVAPGRIGTSTPSLGLPITFSEISNMSILCETSYEIMGMVPDLSYGSHFFQDLVEADIFYLSIFPEMETTTFNIRFFEEASNVLTDILPEAVRFQEVLKVIDTKDQIQIKADLKNQVLKCYKKA